MAKKSKVKSNKQVKVQEGVLSQGFFFVGLVGLIISIWWTYFGLGGKELPLEWGFTLVVVFLIMIIASFRSLERS